MLAKEIMTKNVLIFKELDTLEDVAQHLAALGISGGPVVNGDDKLVGIVSESDILCALKELVDEELDDRVLAKKVHSMALFALIAQRESGISQKLFNMLGKIPVMDVMTKHVISAKPDDRVEHVVSLMIDNNIQRIPIVENSKVVGIVTRADILRAIPVMIK